MFAGVALLASILAVIIVCWESCTTRGQRVALIASMVSVPWLAWLYWLARHVRWVRRRAAAEQAQRDLAGQEATIRFWEGKLSSPFPVERALAADMLVYLGRPAAHIHTPNLLG